LTVSAFTPLARRAATQPADAPGIEPLWFEWLALGGMLAFGAWLLGLRGVWALLLSSDPTGLTLVIIVVFLASTLWCGARSRELQRQRRLLGALRDGRDQGGWASEYLAALRKRPRDENAPLDLLVEMAQGPHHTAWWVNGIQLKLGLLGKVIGFSVLALQIGNIQSFDASQSQDLLKSLTSGLGIALLTTMVGLVGNILLGLQLTRLDRFADTLVAEVQRRGLRVRADMAVAEHVTTAPMPLRAG
jgi:hypothetical protein